MRFGRLARGHGSSPAFAPIRGYSRKGFVIGWLAIVVVVAAGFWMASGLLTHSQSEFQLAQVASAAHG